MSFHSTLLSRRDCASRFSRAAAKFSHNKNTSCSFRARIRKNTAVKHLFARLCNLPPRPPPTSRSPRIDFVIVEKVFCFMPRITLCITQPTGALSPLHGTSLLSEHVQRLMYKYSDWACTRRGVSQARQINISGSSDLLENAPSKSRKGFVRGHLAPLEHFHDALYVALFAASNETRVIPLKMKLSARLLMKLAVNVVENSTSQFPLTLARLIVEYFSREGERVYRFSKVRRVAND